MSVSNTERVMNNFPMYSSFANTFYNYTCILLWIECFQLKFIHSFLCYKDYLPVLDLMTKPSV